MSSDAPNSALEWSDRIRLVSGKGLRRGVRIKRRYCNYFSVRKTSDQSFVKQYSQLLAHCRLNPQFCRTAGHLLNPHYPTYIFPLDLTEVFLEKKSAVQSERPIQRGKAKESIQKPATANGITRGVRAAAAGISAVSRFHTYPYQRGSGEGGRGCGLLNGTEGSAMIKGNLHRAREALRSPRLDLTILNFRLLAIKRPPAFLAFDNWMKCWLRITLVLIRSLKENIFS